MALEGTLEEYNIVAVLQMIAGGGMTGNLTVRNETSEAVVACAEGRVVNAAATFRPDRLGEILIRTHHLTVRQLDEAAAYQAGAGAGRRLGQILLGARMISRDDLVMGLQIQIQEVMSEVLLWSHGHWRFDFAAPAPDYLAPDEGVGLDDLLSGQMLVLDNTESLFEPGAPTYLRPSQPEAPPAVLPPRLPRPADADLIVDPDTLDRLNDVLSGLLLRTEAQEACLIDSSGSLITRRGHDLHRTYPTLFALAAGIFASWQELGRSLGESKASTLLYQGEGLNICLAPVATRAILMTLYQSSSDTGLVNFWSRAASARILHLLELTAPTHPTRNGVPPPDSLPADYQADAARAMDDLLR